MFSCETPDSHEHVHVNFGCKRASPEHAAAKGMTGSDNGGYVASKVGNTSAPRLGGVGRSTPHVCVARYLPEQCDATAYVASAVQCSPPIHQTPGSAPATRSAVRPNHYVGQRQHRLPARLREAGGPGLREEGHVEKRLPGTPRCMPTAHTVTQFREALIRRVGRQSRCPG